MSDAPSILLVIEGIDDRTLCSIVLGHELGEARVSAAGGALEFADCLAERSFDVAVVEASLSWAAGVDVVHTIQRRVPGCVTVLLGDVGARAVECDIVLERTSRGYLELPRAIKRALSRREAHADPPPEAAAYARLLEQLPVGIFSMNEAGALLRSNQIFASLLGFKEPAQLYQRRLPDLFADAEARTRVATLLELGQARRDLETQLRRADGGTTRVSLSFWPVVRKGASGPEVDSFEGVLWDLSGASPGVHPGHVGTQLEQMASAMSHDLQDPLQLISQYALLLEERHAPRLEGDAARLITRLKESAIRMQSMLDGMLDLSRIGRKPRPFQVVDMNELVEEALRNLEGRIAQAGAEIRFDRLPSVVGEPRQLVQLLQNLLGNAIKFKAALKPLIEIRMEERDREWLLSIADNGIGIEPEWTDRIFEIFQRLHTSSEYPGTGIGLAICKRIAECHGGRIWVKSRPGEGSTFFVTLSKDLPGDLPRRESTTSRKAG